MSTPDEIWHQYEDDIDPMIFHDADVILHMNVAARKLFDIEHPRLEGMPLNYIIDHELRELEDIRKKLLTIDPNGIIDAVLPFDLEDGSGFLATIETRWIAPGIARSRLYKINRWTL